MALTFEREIYGWPANMCDTTPLTFHGSQAIGHCHRAGECLMRLSMNVTSPPPIRRADSAIEDRFAELVDADFLQVRKIPHPEEGGKPIKQVLLIRPEDFALHEIWSAPATWSSDAPASTRTSTSSSRSKCWRPGTSRPPGSCLIRRWSGTTVRPNASSGSRSAAQKEKLQNEPNFA